MDTTIAQTFTENTVLPFAEIANANAGFPAPVPKAERVQTIDVIRGFALLGILLMNIPTFGIDGSIWQKIMNGPHNTADFYTLGAIEAFFDGTMRGLFSMLFGAGMILFTMNKKESDAGPSVAEYYYRRLLWLVLFGIINAWVLLWRGDILYFYGLLGMLLFPFRKTQPILLFAIGILCIGVVHFKGMLWYNDLRDKRATYLEAAAAEREHKILTSKQQEAKDAWLDFEKDQQPNPERTAKNVRKMQSGYGTIFTYYTGRNSDSEIWNMYHGMWDMISMMFIGMALLGFGFFANRLSTSTYAMTLLLGYCVGIPIGYFYFKGDIYWHASAGTFVDRYRISLGSLYDIRRLLLALGHASLLMLVFRSKILPWLMKGLANVGQMAFTNYLMQSIICTLYFYGYGLGYYNNLKLHQLYYVVAVVWVFQLIFSSIWLRYFRFGPFEWVWRSLTYWKRQPMKIAASSP